MPGQTITEPVRETVPKVNDELAVGEDLDFQRKWWRFENGVWIFFTLLVVLDVAGAFGRGPLANTRKRSSDGAMDIQYERIERFNTPSMLSVHFGPTAIHDGKVELWASESLVKELGTMRVIPQPIASRVGQGGITYTFDASAAPATIQFALEPPRPGLKQLLMRVQGSQNLELKIFVMP